VLNPAALIDSIVVEHRAFKEAKERIETYLRLGSGTSEPQCLMLAGDSGTGKTLLLNLIKDQFPSVHDDDGWTKPLVLVSLDSKATILGLGWSILTELDEHTSGRYTESALSRRIERLMKECGTVILLCDEFQHFVDRRTDRVLYHAADWLKILVDARKLLLIVAGLPRCEAAVLQNEQLARRFRAPIRLPRFDWQDLQQREEFIALLRGFYDPLRKHYSLPKIYDEDWAFRLYCATGGLIGYLANFLKELLIQANTRRRQGKLTMERFADAFHSYRFSAAGTEELNPFDRAFAPLPTLDVLDKVARIGKPSRPTENRKARAASNSEGSK